MSAYLSVVSKAPGATPLVLVDGPPWSLWILVGKDLGSPSWTHQFAAARGTQGRRAVGGVPDDRQATFTLLADDYADKDDLAADLATLARVLDEVRRYGGYVTFREHNQTRRQTLDVLVGGATIGSWDSHEFDSRNTVRPALSFTCAPYLLGEPMDFLDEFTTDNVNGGDVDYTADAGALTNLAVTGGVLDAAANLTTENRLIHTGSGYTLGDHEVTVRFAPGATISSFKAGGVLKRVDASNYLEVYVDDNGANSRLRVDKVVAAARTNLASTNLGARVAAGRGVWVRGRIEGNVVYAEHFLDTNHPTPAVTPTTSTSVALTTAEAAVFGMGVEGRAGVVFLPQHTDAYIDSLEVLPFTYRDPGVAVVDCAGVIPGDAPAVADVRVGGIAALGTNPWSMFAWASRPNIDNLILNGGFETGVSASPWRVTAVAGVTGAASSINRVDDGTLGAAAKYGEYVGQVVTPATANTGAHHPMWRRFRRGVTYTAVVWVRASAGTTNVRIRLGVSGDITSSTAVALSTTWTQHTVAWTPTATVDVAYLAVEVTAATATTFQIDGAAVYRGTTPPAAVYQQGMGAVPPLAVFPAEGAVTASSNLVVTADATANGGSCLADTSVAGGGEQYYVQFPLGVDLLAGDDYTDGAVTVEVFARVMLSAAFTGGVTVNLTASNEADTTVQAAEYGRPVAAVSGNDKWRMVRCGTLNLPPTRWRLQVMFAVAAGTNAQDFRIDDVFVIPARSRWMLPTGKVGTGDVYPTFLDSSTSWRVVHPDLSSVIQTATTRGGASGVFGSPVELPAGQVAVLALNSGLVPDDPDPVSTDETQGFPPLHLAVTPRWHWLAAS